MKPYVICHMMTTVDGRILPDQWSPPFRDNGIYEKIHGELAGDAWLVGRVTGAEFAKRDAPYPETTAESVGRENWFAQKQADAWAVVLDAKGKVAWGRPDVGGDPLVVILTESVPDGHLAGLREDGVSYIFAGEEEIDLAAALEALNRLGVNRLLLEGGGAANGALLRAGLVDELSQIVVPSVEGVPGNPAVFDIHDGPGALASVSMELMSAQVLEGGCVWLRYRFSWTA